MTKDIVTISFPSLIKLLSGWRWAKEPSVKDDQYYWPVYKETVRKLHPVGYVQWGTEELSPSQGIVTILLKLFKARENIAETKLLKAISQTGSSPSPEELITLLVKGDWLLRWVRLKADGMSPQETRYYAGTRLTRELAEAKDSANQAAQLWLKNLTEKWQALAEGLNTWQGSPEQYQLVGNLHKAVTDLLNQLESSIEQPGSERPCLPGPRLYSFEPGNLSNFFALTLEFWTALAKAILTTPSGFDWKEIGAVYYQMIGGSKVFDQQKDRLVNITEELFGVSLSEVGLISRGSLYSIYLAGVVGSGDEGKVGSRDKEKVFLQALTNIEVEELAQYSTRAKHLILTENRALLLKMYKSGWLGRRQDVLVIGVDGRLRQAHKKLITLMKRGKPALAFSLCVDTDQAGREIAEALVGLFPDLRLVIPAGSIPTGAERQEKTRSFEEWVQWLKAYPNQGNTEQEENLGTPQHWDTIWSILPGP